MKRKILAALSALTLAAVLCGCSSRNESIENEVPSVPQDSSAFEDNSEKPIDVLQKLREAIATAYGDDYLPDTDMTQEMIQNEFTLTPDMYEEIVAQAPMIGFHPDRLVIVKASPDMADKVKQAFEAARESMINAQVQYPSNLAKVNEARVLQNGDYVCFMLLGAPYEGEDDSIKAADFAKEQIQIGINAFNEFFEKSE